MGGLYCYIYINNARYNVIPLINAAVPPLPANPYELLKIQTIESFTLHDYHKID